MRHEIEVCDEHRKDIDEVLEALDSFTGHARRIGPNATQRRGQQVAPTPPRNGRSRGSAGYDAKAVREWAAANGIEVNERRRISTSVLEQYRAAQGEPPPPAHRWLEEPKPAPSSITVVKAPPREAPVPDVRTSPMPDPEVIRNFDWDQVNLDDTAAKLCQLMRNGVPPAIRYSYSPDVLALYGVDLNLLEGALRHPERVEIRPESFNRDKRYPVLAFHRGDVQVILGLRQPVSPKVIAAYATSRLEHDTHRVGHTGSGGSKRSVSGLPSNPRQVATQLDARRAQAELYPLPEGATEVASKPKVDTHGRRGRPVQSGRCTSRSPVP